MSVYYTPKSKLMNDYFTWISAVEGLAMRTCDAYGRNVELFIRFLGDGDDKKGLRRLPDANAKDIQAFIISLRRRELKNATLANIVSALRSFYGWMHVEHDRPDNPALDVKRPRPDKRLPVVLTREEADLIRASEAPSEGLTAKRTDLQRLRDRAIIELLYGGGLRRMEIAALDAHDIDFEKRCLRIIGKRNKQRIVFFSEDAANAMLAYLAVRPQDGDKAFFLGRGRKRLGLSVINHIFKEHAQIAGIARATPHVMRHTFATNLVENRMNINAIKEILGHSSLATTTIYLNVSGENIREEFEKAQTREHERRFDTHSGS
jgi:site-specific recombinase XerD